MMGIARSISRKREIAALHPSYGKSGAAIALCLTILRRVTRNRDERTNPSLAAP
jgi:hypothetical protein